MRPLHPPLPDIDHVKELTNRSLQSLLGGSGALTLCPYPYPYPPPRPYPLTAPFIPYPKSRSYPARSPPLPLFVPLVVPSCPSLLAPARRSASCISPSSSPFPSRNCIFDARLDEATLGSVRNRTALCRRSCLLDVEADGSDMVAGPR